MKTLIVENEAATVRVLQAYLRLYCPDVEVMGTAGSVASALMLIEMHPEPELLILDVELDDGTSMQLLDHLKDRRFQVIFITAHDRYAIQAFRYSAVEFLLKPIDPEELAASIGKVREKMEQEQLLQQLSLVKEMLRPEREKPQKIVIRDRGNIHVLQLADILYLESDGAYTQICLREGKQILASKNLRHFETLLADADFLRIHHSFLINARHITHYDKANNSLTLCGVARLPVAMRKKEALFAALEKIR